MLDVEQLLYTLKLGYGYPLTFLQKVSDSPNLQTGALIVREIAFQIERALVLPVSVAEKYFNHPGDTRFDYGGDLDIGKRVFIIDKRDLPVTPSNEFSFVIYDHQRYSLEVLNQFDFDECYMIKATLVKGVDVNQQIEISIQDFVYVSQSAGQMWLESVTDAVNPIGGVIKL
jgi:hypothetical protein